MKTGSAIRGFGIAFLVVGIPASALCIGGAISDGSNAGMVDALLAASALSVLFAGLLMYVGGTALTLLHDIANKQ